MSGLYERRGCSIQLFTDMKHYCVSAKQPKFAVARGCVSLLPDNDSGTG